MESCLRILCLVSVFVNFCSCGSPEPGIFELVLSKENPTGGVSKILDNATEIAITVNCSGSTGKFNVEWIVRYTECNNLKIDASENTTRVINSLFRDRETWQAQWYSMEDYFALQKNNMTNEIDCTVAHWLLQDETDTNFFSCYSTLPNQHCTFLGVLPPPAGDSPPEKPVKAPGKDDPNQINKRATDADTDPKASTKAPVKKKLSGRVTKTNERVGRYWVLVRAIPLDATPKADWKVTLTITMKSAEGFLSAHQAPLLLFYGLMCGAYSILTLVWLILLAMQWRDLLRIQFWIGGVMLLGLLEKAVFYAEYENINSYGKSVPGAINMAELISCFKRSLARMLVVIVSLGYGITRPRLGKDLHWVLGVGMLYFIMSSVESCLRVKGSEQNDLIALLPLSVLDAIICWWIFKSLVDTTRTLRLRRNMAKLWLYRHFTNTLIFCVVAALVFLLWSVKVYHWTECIEKWNELWLDDAYWHVLFCIILVVIVILFRPTANNQRYAYSPLTDREGEDESQEPMLSDAFEGMKMRNVVTNRNESQTSHRTDDDLKWVEDNIPAAVADAALGAFDDSEEELVTNLERNKME